MPIHRTIHSNFKLENSGFDIGGLVESVVLFDTTILADSSDVPGLIASIGNHGIEALLKEGLIRVNCSAPSAQATMDYRHKGFFKNRPLDRPLRFGADLIYTDPARPENQSEASRFGGILKKARRSLGLSKKELHQVRDLILTTSLIIHPKKLSFISDFCNDLNENHDLFCSILIDHLINKHGFSLCLLDIEFSILEIEENVFEIRTNLPEKLDIPAETLHEYLKPRFFDISGCNLSILRTMNAGAICGLPENHADIVARRADWIASVQSQSDARPAFTKILEATNVPTLEPDTRIDAEALIKLRESDEARVFRDWIHGKPDLTGAEIGDLLGGWRHRLGDIVDRPIGKTLRLIASLGVSAGFGDPSGLSGAAADTYLKQLLPTTGPISFIRHEFRDHIDWQARR
jgi:hypothetical protein